MGHLLVEGGLNEHERGGLTYSSPLSLHHLSFLLLLAGLRDCFLTDLSAFKISIVTSGSELCNTVRASTDS